MIFKNSAGTEVKIFANIIDETAQVQIKALSECEPYKNSKIRIMPDVHAGAGCTIGTTMTITDCVTPNLVGVDIGCGMLTTVLDARSIDFKKLDAIIYKYIPSGMSVHQTASNYDFSELICAHDPSINLKRAACSLGTLGGGNHFIEIDIDDEHNFYLIIHSGSRNLGQNLARFYQAKANATNPCENKALSFLSGKDFHDYIHDIKIIQQFASDNRKRMAEIILDKAGLQATSQFETIHNYIDTDKMIVRKGAIRAEAGEKVLIPVNMKDGCIIAEGLGNEDWNYSAPHGAGRILSRREARERLSLAKFQRQMEGIYSSSVRKSTLDESPSAYKQMSDILPWIEQSVRVQKIIKAVYNFKA